MTPELTLRSITDRHDRGCVDVDPSVFHPRRRTRSAVDYAKRICDPCSIADECRAFASAHDLDGIWGGSTEVERRAAPLNETP